MIRLRRLTFIKIVLTSTGRAQEVEPGGQPAEDPRQGGDGAVGQPRGPSLGLKPARGYQW